MPFLSLGLAQNPTGVAVHDGIRVWSYDAMEREATLMARRLSSLGVREGTVVALAGTPDAFLLAAAHATWKAGGAVAPLNPRWTRTEASAALEALTPALLLQSADDQNEPWIAGDFSTLPAFCLGPGNGEGRRIPSLESVGPASGPLPGLSPGGTAVHLLTSGTSGDPSVVSLQVGNLLASAHGSRARLGLGPLDRWLGSLSLAHVGGIALVTRAAVLGSRVVLRGPFSLEIFLDLAGRGEVTHASLVPTMLFDALGAWKGRTPPDTLRCLLVGGAPASDDLLRRALAAGLPVALTYGLTEATSQVATAPPELVRAKPGSVGLPLSGVEVTLAEDGEILVKGPTVAPGQQDGDGWLHTGDLGRKDPEGHLWITGRRSERIISGGVNVNPREVERILESHPLIVEAAVVGVPDVRWGERVVAAVVSTGGRDLSAAILLEEASKVLSAAKRPRALRFVDSLPRNANGKVDREQLRRLFR